MTSWTDKDFPSPTPSVTADAAVTTPAVTPFCDAYCVLFFDVRLHSLDCDVKNRRDPILKDRVIPVDFHRWPGADDRD